MAQVPAEQRRQQLVAAAFRVIAREGVAAASTRRIANEAKVPAAVVHYCFHSVEELIDALMTSVFGEALEMAGVALRPRGGVEQSLKAALRRMWLVHKENPAMHRAVHDLVSYALRRPAATEIVRRHQLQLFELTGRYLADLAARNECQWQDPAESLGRVLISTVDGVLLNWLVDKDDISTEAALDWLAHSIAARVAP